MVYLELRIDNTPCVVEIRVIDDVDNSDADRSEEFYFFSAARSKVVISSIFGVSIDNLEIRIDRTITLIDVFTLESGNSILLVAALADNSVYCWWIPIDILHPKILKDENDMLDRLSSMQTAFISIESDKFPIAPIKLASFMTSITKLSIINASTILVAATAADTDCNQEEVKLILLSSTAISEYLITIPVQVSPQMGKLSAILAYEYQGAKTSLSDNCFISSICRYQRLWASKQTIVFLGTSSGGLLWVEVPNYESACQADDVTVSARIIDKYPSAITGLSYLRAHHQSQDTTECQTQVEQSVDNGGEIDAGDGYISHLCVAEACGYITCIGIKYHPHTQAFFSDCVSFDLQHSMGATILIGYGSSIIYVHNHAVYMLTQTTNDKSNELSDNESGFDYYQITDASYRPVDSFTILRHHVVIGLVDGTRFIRQISGSDSQPALTTIRSVFGYYERGPVSKTVSALGMKIGNVSQTINHRIRSEREYREQLDQLDLSLLQTSSLLSILFCANPRSDSHHPISIPGLQCQVLLGLDEFDEGHVQVNLSTSSSEVLRSLHGANLLVMVHDAGHSSSSNSFSYKILFTQDPSSSTNAMAIQYHSRYRSPMIPFQISHIFVDVFILFVADSKVGSAQNDPMARLHIHHQEVSLLDAAMLLGRSSHLRAERTLDYLNQQRIADRFLHGKSSSNSHHSTMKSLEVIIPRINTVADDRIDSYDKLITDIDAKLQSYQQIYPSTPNTILSYQSSSSSSSSVETVLRPRFIQHSYVTRNALNDPDYLLRLSYERLKVDTGSSDAGVMDKKSSYLYSYLLQSPSSELLVWMHQAISKQILHYLQSHSTKTPPELSLSIEYEPDDILYLPKQLQGVIEDVVRLSRSLGTRFELAAREQTNMSKDLLSMLRQEESDQIDKESLVREATMMRDCIMGIIKIYSSLRQNIM
jgi:hypothetical protein